MNTDEMIAEMKKRRGEVAAELARLDAMLAAAGQPQVPSVVAVPLPCARPHLDVFPWTYPQPYTVYGPTITTTDVTIGGGAGPSASTLTIAGLGALLTDPLVVDRNDIINRSLAETVFRAAPNSGCAPSLTGWSGTVTLTS